MISEFRLLPGAAKKGGTLACVCLLHFGAFQLHAQAGGGQSTSSSTDFTANLIAGLSAQGIPVTRILGVDARGVPILCGTGEVGSRGPSPASLPPGTRGWEAIPGVVRVNALDTFRLEVNVNSDVADVSLDTSFLVIPLSGGTIQTLLDDGLGQDRVAGDHIYTSGLLRPNPAWLFDPHYYFDDTNSPPGLDWWDIGTVNIHEWSGETNGFLINPTVGTMDPHIPLTTPLLLATNVQVTPHLVNIRGTEQAAQKYLRGVSYPELRATAAAMYGVVPDVFDLLTFFTTDHVEKQPPSTTVNFNAGVHSAVRVDYNGTGLGVFNSSSLWGSAGRLQGVSVLDTGDRGAYGNNVTHELLHQWSAYVSPSLGMSDGAHYSYLSGAASILGGATFSATNGGFLINCNESSWGGHYAAPIDKYMMGLIDGSAVPPIPVSGGQSPFTICGQVLPTGGIISTVTVAQIQQLYGVRTPGPATSQKDFRMGFVIESNERLLTATELTFFEILARAYTQPWPASKPDPYVGFSWVSITKYFGSGTTWRSYVLAYVQPRINLVRSVPGGKVAVAGAGFPRESYTLQGSTNLVNWSPVATLRADIDGGFQYTNSTTMTRQFYRAVWNE